MKKLFYIVLFVSITNIAFTQGTCNTALPFCTGTNYTFPASTNTPPPTGANFGCLSSQPNPAFYYMEIDNPGNMTINIQGINGPPGTTPIPGWGGNTNDIDFICWGPFTNPATMCNQLTAANIVDCSYSTTWNEDCDIEVTSKEVITDWETIPALIILLREIAVSGLREYLAGIKVSVPVSKIAKLKTSLQLIALAILILSESGISFINSNLNVFLF